MSIVKAPIVKVGDVELEVREWAYLDQSGRATAIEVLHAGSRMLLSYYRTDKTRQTYLDMVADRVNKKIVLTDAPKEDIHAGT